MEDYYPKRPIEYLKSNFEQILKTLDILFNISFSMAQINMAHAFCQLNKMEYSRFGTFDIEIIEEKDFRLGKHDTFFSLSICNFEIDGDLINENGIKFQMDEVIIEFIFDMVIPKITILKLRLADFTPSDPNIEAQKLKEISDKIVNKLTEITTMHPTNNCKRTISVNGVLYTPEVEIYSIWNCESSVFSIVLIKLQL